MATIFNKLIKVKHEVITTQYTNKGELLIDLINKHKTVTTIQLDKEEIDEIYTQIKNAKKLKNQNNLKQQFKTI